MVRPALLLLLLLLLLLAGLAAARLPQASGPGGVTTETAAVAYTQAALDDEVTGMPGLNYQPRFRHFSGYINVAEEGEPGRFMHYYFVESEGNPAADPVVLWTNGGPGCSGLLGFFTEQGPFRPNAEGILEENAFRWNQIASMLFIEAPCGVGFSYPEDPADYAATDRTTARDNYRLILGFLERFPAYQANPFHISSESYGGHYMPTLAAEIVLRQRAGQDPPINFRGFAVGNPFTSWMNNKVATIETFWGHQLVSYASYTAWKRQCGHISSPAAYVRAGCPKLEAVLNREVGALNPYALDWPVCLEGGASPAAKGRAQRTWLLHHATPGELRAGLGIIDIADYEPCEDNYLVSYLNRKEVKEALHVRADIEWTECSRTVRYQEADLLLPMEPLYEFLAQEKWDLDILVYSGDDDSVCGLWGTQAWMNNLRGFEVQTRWAQWRDAAGQPAGFVTQWSRNLTLATVHGGGHEVPTYTPRTALQLFQWYLDRTWFDPHAFASAAATDDDADTAGTESESESGTVSSSGSAQDAAATAAVSA